MNSLTGRYLNPLTDFGCFEAIAELNEIVQWQYRFGMKFLLNTLGQ